MGNIVQNDQSNLEKFQYCMEKEEKIPYPTQCGSSVSEYIKMIKLHAIGVGEDLDGIDIKVKFICGLSPVNEKRVHEFGVKKPLSEIFEHLLKPSSKATCPESDH